jgi:ribonuclease E
MLIDATHTEETRVAIVDGNRLVEYDYESKVRKQLKGSIFLAKVTRVEPSLQAAFVNFGGNRHGFLPFSEIHPDYFRIPVADRDALLAAQQAELEEHDEEMQQAEAEIEERATRAQSDSSSEIAEEEEDDLEPVVEVGGEDEPLADEEDADVETVASEEEDASEQDEDTYTPPMAMESRADVLEGPVLEEEAADEDDSADEGDDAFEAEDDGEDGDSEEGDAEEAEAGEDAQVSAEEGAQAQGRGRGRDRGRGRGRGRRFGRGRGGRNPERDDQSVDTLGGDGADGDRPFRFNLKRNYKIQEVIKRGQIMLIQVSKEERGNKGAAVTTYLSMPGRYCVLMPNSPRGGGVSRKIASFKDRQRMKEILGELSVPEGMSVILRTAGVARTSTEIKRDLDYLTRLWNGIREHTLKSVAPALIYEEGSLIKRAIRDLYSRDIEDIYVSGDEGYRSAHDFMRMLMPSHAKKVKSYKNDRIPMFHKFGVENQISDIGEPIVNLKSGGYLVINPTEALVSVDVNSGRATKERHIEETALKTNLEAADEVARQLRLRDLGGLVVIDFIDMEDRRNNRKVEQRLRDALSNDRARIQVGRISSFGLLELSRQRLNPSLAEAQQEVCAHCAGTGRVKTLDFSAISIIRALEAEGIKGKNNDIILTMATSVALYVMNFKRKLLNDIEARYGFSVRFVTDDTLSTSQYRLETTARVASAPIASGVMVPVMDDGDEFASEQGDDEAENLEATSAEGEEQEAGEGDDDQRRDGRRRRGRRGGRNRRGRDRDRGDKPAFDAAEGDASENGNRVEQEDMPEDDIGNRVPEESMDDSAGNRRDDEEGQREGGRNGGQRGRGRGGRGRNNNQRGRGRGGERGEGRQREAAAGGDAAPLLRESPSPRTDNVLHAQAPIHVVSEPPLVVAARPTSSLAAPARKDYETLNQAPDKKKKGWWNKLME